jgi:hypothetical protein
LAILSALFAITFLLAAFSLVRKLRQKPNAWAEEYRAPWAEIARGVFEMENSGSTEDRLGLALQTGAQKLGLPFGLATLHRGDTGTILNLHSEGYNFPAGLQKKQSLASRRLFCGEIKEGGGVLAIDFASLSEWRRHSAFQQLGCESYLGCRVNLEGGDSISLGFFNSRSREQLYSKSEKEFVLQLTRWVAALIQREKAAAPVKGKEAFAAETQLPTWPH